MSDSQNQVREAAAREWKTNASLHAEFGGNLAAYQAYRVAVSSGRVRVAPATVQHFENQSHAARSSVGAFNPPAGTVSVLDAMAEFKRSGRSYIRTDLVAHVASRTGLSLHDASEAIKDKVK
jgi:hypothetical protein